ncbi:YsnF/AvaK domain-containing protein [Sodalis endosymbiont of Spalangia cameroni]|uniref:YsnF/AvaK domain-containing protein n=1 Tax=Sodalis praecaptivus TaxID=1239307 RepID=UPI0031F9BA37
MAHEKIVTLFDTVQQAKDARRELEAAGFANHDISIISGEDLQSEGKAIRHPSLWQRLFGTGVDKENAELYTQALDTGGVILTLRAKEDDVPQALAILDASGAAAGAGADYAGEPDTGYARDVEDYQTTSPIGRAQAGIDAPDYEDEALLPVSRGVLPDAADVARDGAPSYGVGDETSPASRSLDPDAPREEVLRLAEERLEVGKRVVKEGATRVRRYVVNEDVEAEVALHEQHADIFRRARNEPAYLDEVDWSDKTVEVAETREQPVINKTADIVEEVVVRTDGSDRVARVNETVRRQEVDIEHIDDERTREETYPAAGEQRLRGEDPLLEEERDPLWVDEDGLPNEERNGALDPLRDPKRK